MDYPITSFLIILLVSIYIYQYIDTPIMILNIKNLFLQKLVSTFLHLDGFHLFQNCITLNNFRFIESIITSKEYIKMILFLVVINSVIWNIMSELFFIRFSIGFSGVLFGLITIFPQNSLFGFHINKYLFPFVMLFLMQLLVSNISFMGHLIGIISGHLYLYLYYD